MSDDTQQWASETGQHDHHQGSEAHVRSIRLIVRQALVRATRKPVIVRRRSAC
jgi:hypothetical protein